MKLSLSFGQRIALLVLLFIVGALLTGGLQLLAQRLTDNAVAATRITIVMQDLLAFILPALITAMLLTRLPADFLHLRPLPSGRMTLTALATLLLALPAIEGINDLCTMLPWPDAILRAEAAAEAATMQIMGPHNPANLMVALLIMAVLTGLAEELFFRGAMQQIFASRPMSVHLAIWLTAIIFALMHGQAVGLLPRALLGAFFGYTVLWTGSIWPAVLCHIANNAIAVGTLWAGIDMPSIPALSIASACLAGAGIHVLMRQSKSRSMGM